MSSNEIFQPLVSVITVVYNSEKLLEKTILSVVNQNSHNFEFIIIDGGSTDGTIEIIKKYQCKINFWLSEQDQGIYDAMNKGMSHAKGEYIWFVNSGDTLFSDDIISFLEMDNNKADIYYGETMLVNSMGHILGTRTELTTRKLPEVLSWRHMVNGMVVSHQSIIVRKELASGYNLYYKCSADIDWVIKALKNAGSIRNTNRILSNYLIGGFSISNRRRCLKERFMIYVNHFGYVATMWSHIKLIFINLCVVLVGRKNY